MKSSTLLFIISSILSSTNASYWLETITRQGIIAYGSNASSYKLFRNVKDYGAKGDGTTDDTSAINSAITDGSRCGQGCDSSTTTPALVYFPAGTYIVSAPLVQLYYTQFVGDATSPPTLKAAASFAGMAVIDADPYLPGGANWFTNQNNFYRQVRNFVIDLTAMPNTAGAGIHWQVAQATSLQNIIFNMRTDGGTANAQVGIFMDNGSGGFMTDLTFNGGKYGAFFGNQQFTTRNLVFSNQLVAGIFMNWNWAWTLQGISIDNAPIGIDMSQGGTSSQSVGSVMLVDSTISNCPIGISTAYATSEAPYTNGTLIVQNVDMSTNVPVAISSSGQSTLLAGKAKVSTWTQGSSYTGSTQSTVQGTATSVTIPDVLKGGDGKVYTRSKPQYETLDASSFVSVRSKGATGDGATDDTAAIQAIFDAASASDVIYFDHGAYVITSTVKVPKNIRITGEMWPLIMASGKAFTDMSNPTAVFQVGEVGDEGTVEISDLVFETLGAAPGAVLVEWNVAAATQGSVGMWDVHFRIGGTAGTKLQSDTCTKNPNATHSADPACEGAFLLLHVTSKASIYLENNWFWVSDHELDRSDHNQIDIYNGRGVLVESEAGPVWMYGTSSEHSVLYNYQISHASNVYMALIQTETPYFQANPNAETPYPVNTKYRDPDFSKSCSSGDTCAKAWGLRILSSSDVYVFGAGLYSFFDNYDQTCLNTEDCQDNIVSLENSANIYLFGLSTKASKTMVTVGGVSEVVALDNDNNFCQTIALYQLADGATVDSSVNSGSAGGGSSVTPPVSGSTVSGSTVSSSPATSSGTTGDTSTPNTASGVTSGATSSQGSTGAPGGGSGTVPPSSGSTVSGGTTGSTAGSGTSSTTPSLPGSSSSSTTQRKCRLRNTTST